jgi:hypothetical protein
VSRIKFIAAAGLAFSLAGAALAQSPAQKTAPPQAQTKGGKDAETALLASPEEKAKCIREIRRVGTIIGDRTCQTRAEYESSLKEQEGRLAAERDSSQQFLRQGLTVPSIAGGGAAF